MMDDDIANEIGERADEMLDAVLTTIEADPHEIIFYLSVALGRMAAELHDFDADGLRDEVGKATRVMGAAASNKLIAMTREAQLSCAGRA
jgi:hypothetical protein